MSFVAPWRTERSLLNRLLLSRQGEIRPFWGWLVVVGGISLLLIALTEIVLLLLAMQGIPVLKMVLGSQKMIWLLRHIP
ncbi:MAG: hypothetical protein RL318_284 [Fibrobacterota bacterium]|jgi:hypothetical protein